MYAIFLQHLVEERDRL